MANENASSSGDNQVAVSEASPKRPRRKGIVIGVIAVILVVAGAGFWVWHEQPTFCNSVCHTPMDSYVETYYQQDGSTLSAMHARAGKTCLDCHPAKIDEQVSEATKWVAGDYAYDSDSGKLLSHSDEFATQENCLRSGCHDLTLDELSQKTEDMAWNPHDFSEHGVTNCGDCHKAHGQSVLVCSECHYQAAENVPEGWTSLPYRPESEASMPYHAEG